MRVLNPRVCCMSGYVQPRLCVQVLKFILFLLFLGQFLDLSCVCFSVYIDVRVVRMVCLCVCALWSAYLHVGFCLLSFSVCVCLLHMPVCVWLGHLVP